MKRVSIIFLLFVFALTLAACGAKDGGEAAVSGEDADITLDDIFSANIGSDLVEKYPSLTVEYTEYGADGAQVYTQRAQVKSTGENDYLYSAWYNGEGAEVETGGIYCVYDSAGGATELYALTPETYAADLSDILSTFVFTKLDEETLVSVTGDGDSYIVTTTAPVYDEVGDYIMENYGKTPDSMSYSYTVNKDDLLVTSSVTSAVCGSETFKVADFVFTYDEDFDLPYFASELLGNADSYVKIMKDGDVCCKYAVRAGTVLLTDYFNYSGYTLCADENGGDAAAQLEAGKTYYLVPNV